MGEIDTKPIESVQAALSLFEEKTDHRKTRPTGTDEESDKERELEGVLKDLANYKVQLEAKDAAYMQVLLKLQHHQYTADELSILLQNIEVERDRYIEESKEARTQVHQLESKVREMSDQLSDTLKVREQLMHVFSELKATQAELLSMETELADARDSELKALTQAELMETAFVMEKERAEELLKHVSELSEAVVMSKVAAIEAEKEKLVLLSEKDAEIELAAQATLQAQEQLEDVRKQIGMMEELEDQLLAKSSFIDMLQLEINQVNEQLSFSEKAASDGMNDLKQLEEELEVKERKILDQEGFIQALEMELNQLKLGLINANEVTNSLKSDVEILTEELQKAKTEIDEIKESENKALVEIAMLESQLHRGRSKVAAAEAAEARTENVKSGLYLAIQQLAIEAETAKKENRMLKQGADSLKEENQEHSILVDPHFEKDSQEDVVVSRIDELNPEAKERTDENEAQVTISLKEYESLIKMAEQADQIPLPLEEGFSQLSLSTMKEESELECLKKELEAAMEKVAQFRNRAEQAATRADLAEKAKAGLEDQIRIWRQVKQKRRAALAALTEVSTPKQFSPPPYESPKQLSPPASEETQKICPPLGKILNMKF
ncbi:PREDICTED: WEB family [Prunus dulcis]|uniref:PREDICTED: WEB family n=1 Tax=Prunus dulcis TaxID=3755 RepID=A0A5E4G8P3_PRUDU|nr:protein WEAK CHLOROPLAST MOVEMENT UNDER BLUE LIGHT 1-like isoform X1 [Prunus dulcis]XP_034214680.1 protein WEAK CHLOROPLAST MOVEMENT UNDER BLUE LIGHT 1-like isoform X1 [Prunus dulcis]VVA36215.1 PREDICTED: WEB family [Prunus dulcis]